MAADAASTPAPKDAGTGAVFAFFVVSGFCSLVYEVVWLRLAMAAFGVTTPTVSIVLSVFMAGLALGSWAAGIVARRLAGRPPSAALRAYAAAELAIAASGLVVPAGLRAGGALLGARLGGAAWGSGPYYLASGAWVALLLLPFCTCMGATFPLAIAAVSRAAPRRASRSFSYLYVANVLGATLGTVASAAALIELLGFKGTVGAAALLNALLGAGAFALARRRAWSRPAVPAAPAARPAGAEGPALGRAVPATLFATGLVSMAAEVVWVRQFTPYLGNVVYAFASILALYLAATLAGSRLYRGWARKREAIVVAGRGPAFFGALACAALLPLAAADHRLPAPPGEAGGLLRLALGIGPFCLALGFVTPLLVDRWSAGDPRRVGAAYATNVVGCIVGPLAAGFVLLPALGERWSLAALAGLTLALGAAVSGSSPRRALAPLALAAGASAAIALATDDFERQFPNAVVRRDATATVVAWGEGRDKRLLVDGIGMTRLTPTTKMMAHLPLAMQARPPERALVVCLGMGTSFRSALSWGIRADAVELVPSVASVFPFFHADAAALLRSPRARVVVDDGRRFLERSTETYDAIVIDPPPPPEASGSSLLYSREFYALARRHLRRGGILQQWVPGGGDAPLEPAVLAAFVRALREEFPYVRLFGSLEGWGLHMLASAEPMPAASAAELAARMPPAAARDLVEWGPATTAAAQLDLVLGKEVAVGDALRSLPPVPALDDDRPLNEYYLLRRLGR